MFQNFGRTIILDPYFKMKHLNHAKNNQNFQKLLISQFYIDKDDFFSFYCSSLLVKDVQKRDCRLNIEPAVIESFVVMMACLLLGLVIFQ